MAIITISREFGAGGSSVAKLVADELGAELVDATVVSEVARRLEYPESAVASADERPETFSDRLLGSLRYLTPVQAAALQPRRGETSVEPRWEIVNLTQELIREVASHGNAVIVGRGGALVLRDRPNALHVFLQASNEVRIEAIMRRMVVSERVARERIRKTDAERAAYIRQLYHADWHDSANYDFVINTGRLGYAGAAELIVAAVARRSTSEAPRLTVIPRRDSDDTTHGRPGRAPD